MPTNIEECIVRFVAKIICILHILCAILTFQTFLHGSNLQRIFSLLLCMVVNDDLCSHIIY